MIERNWYLIQRCEKRESASGHKGVDKILSLDYMGSAEFEFGAVGKILREFRNCKGALTLTKSKVVTRFNKPVWIVAPTEANVDAIEAKLVVLSKDKMHLKERSYFDYWFNKEASDYKKKITSWLVLDMPVFFSVDEGTARKMLAELKLETASAAE